METSYKEKYEQAIERLKQWDREHHCAGYVLSDRDKFIFPELTESEDEKIRKELIDAVQGLWDNDALPMPLSVKRKDKWLAWLERQGGYANFRNKAQVGDRITKNEDGVLVNLSQLKRVAKPSEKQGEQEKDILEDAILDGNEDGLIAETIKYKKEKQGEKKPVIEMKTAAESLGVDSETYNKIVDECIFGEQKPEENKGNIVGISANSEWCEENEPHKELAESYLAKFDEKFPILPTLKGKQLADYKNFLNKCQQIFGLKYWGIRPLQAKLFEKLPLLWAAWGAEHLQGLGQTDGDMDNEISMWSEEDEDYLFLLNSICKDAEEKYRNSPDVLVRKEIANARNWLKSLRPQSRWKPSSEQIGLLQAIINEPNNAASESCQIVLREVLEQLKKLKGGKV